MYLEYELQKPKIGLRVHDFHSFLLDTCTTMKYLNEIHASSCALHSTYNGKSTSTHLFRNRLLLISGILYNITQVSFREILHNNDHIHWRFLEKNTNLNWMSINKYNTKRAEHLREIKMQLYKKQFIPLHYMN